MSSAQAHPRADRLRALLAAVAGAAVVAGCATSGAIRAGQRAERAEDYDRAVVEYTKAVQADPDNRSARLALDRVKLRASQDHFFRGRRLAAAERHEEALLELQIASELNPGSADVEAALRDARQRVRTKLAVSREGKTELQTLIERTRDLPPPGLDLPADVKLPDSLVFSNASSRAVLTFIARFAGISLVFDPAFRDSTISIDLRNFTLQDALTAVASSTQTFYRVTAQKTITIIPDTAAKRREYEESVVRTFYLSNADLKEVIDLLRIVIDVRQISPITAMNAISLKDTPERIAAAARLISAIDKARAEVVIDVQLMEVDRTKLREYGLQIASPSSGIGLSGSADVNRDSLTLRDLRTLSQSDIFLTGLPALYYRLLKTDGSSRTLASTPLRTSEGLPAQARFGEQTPVPEVTFAPIATGGLNQQPVTSFQYRNIGVNIDITPRMHHNDDVTLALKLSVTSISGVGFGGLPTFGNREINTTIRLRDGETNMLAGLIRDDERHTLSGIPGLSDLPFIGRLFARNQKETHQTDIILTLTPHIVRVLDINEADLRPFRLGRDTGTGAPMDLPAIQIPPRDKEFPQDAADPAQAEPVKPAFPQPLPGTPLPGAPAPATPPVKKKGGGGSTLRD